MPCYFRSIKWNGKKKKKKIEVIKDKCFHGWLRDVKDAEPTIDFLLFCHGALACCETSTDLPPSQDILCGTACSNTQDKADKKTLMAIKTNNR